MSARSRWWPSALKWLRTLHIHLSLLGLLLALFFGVTGFILNHEGWFGVDRSQVESRELSLPAELVGAARERPLAALRLVEHLRAEHGVKGLLESLQVEPGEVRLLFERPGGSTDIVIQRSDGVAELRAEGGGLALLLTEIHQGKSTGLPGGLMLDLAALLFLLFGLTGGILWWTLPKRRRTGWIALGLSLTFCLFVGLFSLG